MQGLVSDIQTAVAKNPAIVGPLAGRSKQGLAAAGLGDKDAQSLLDNLSLMQSALMKMHSGSRGSEILLRKAETLIGASQNPDQMQGALSSIQNIANQYADEDKLVTVADYKSRQQQQQPTQAQPGQTANTGTQQRTNGNRTATPNAPTQRIVPAGATPGRDANGNIIGYRTANGTGGEVLMPIPSVTPNPAPSQTQAPATPSNPSADAGMTLMHRL